MACLQRTYVSTTLADKPSSKELLQLAMQTVGQDLEDQGYEFIAVNSELKKDPQFVCKRNKKLFFVLVRACVYPENPESYDTELVDKLKSHADKFKAALFYAGVGFAHAAQYDLPLQKSQPYAVNYKGLQKL